MQEPSENLAKMERRLNRLCVLHEKASAIKLKRELKATTTATPMESHFKIEIRVIVITFGLFLLF